MNTRMALTLIVALALTLTACGPTTINQAAPPPARNLSVNGVGEVKLSPDIAYIRLGVRSDGTDAGDTVAANTSQTTALMESLKAAGVAAEDISTSNFSIWPSAKYAADGNRVGTNYVVDNTVSVAVRDLDRLGELLESAVTAGANSVDSITYDVEDKAKAIEQARVLAVEDAKVQAAALARTAGLTLGEIETISFYDGGATPYSEVRGAGGGAQGGMAAEVPIQPGRMTLRVSVRITYSIK